MKDPYSIFNELLESKEMPDVHFRRYAEIYMEQMISMLKEKDITISEQKEKMLQIEELAASFLKNIKKE